MLEKKKSANISGNYSPKVFAEATSIDKLSISHRETMLNYDSFSICQLQFVRLIHRLTLFE